MSIVFRRDTNVNIFKYLKRDVPSITFSNARSGTGLFKVFLEDPERNHREVAYVQKDRSFKEAYNQLAYSYITKFNLEFDVLRLATPKGKVD